MAAVAWWSGKQPFLGRELRSQEGTRPFPPQITKARDPDRDDSSNLRAVHGRACKGQCNHDVSHVSDQLEVGPIVSSEGLS